MSYTIKVCLNKKLTRAETKHILDFELPEKLKRDFWLIKNGDLLTIWML